MAHTRPWTVEHHAALLIYAGLLNGKVLRTLGPGGLTVFVSDLTSTGHDWRASIHSKNIFEKTLDFAKQKGVDLTFEMVKTVAVGFAASRLGLPG